MHKKEKIAIAILAAALVLVIGLILILGNRSEDESANAPTAQTIQPEVTADVQPTQNTDAADQTAEPQDGGDGAQQALDEEAQGTVYEGAIAGLTEEEIAKLALAEEEHQSGENAEDTESTQSGSVD